MNQQMLNILIVEDDKIQLCGLKHIIEEEYSDINIYTAQTYNDAISVIKDHNIDLFMLDIDLGGTKNGLDVCDYIRQIPSYVNTPVIFITDIMVPTLDVINKYHCQYYFSKPYSHDDVVKGINSVYAATDTQDSRIQLKDTQGIIFHILMDDIIYVRASGHHKHIFTSNGDFIVTASAFRSALEDKAVLIQCHKSCYINPVYIQSYDRSNAIISLNGVQESIPVGRKYKTYIESYLEN